MNNEICKVYCYFSEELEKIITADFVYYKDIDKYLKYLNRSFPKTYRGMQRINVINRQKTPLNLTEDEMEAIWDEK
tara:strand:- start:388 stop:615 length:228 start_codon:yes stop_codon:yes gene_type:complete